MYASRRFELIVQTENYIKSYDVVIKNQDSQEELIASVADPSNYRVVGTTDITEVGTYIIKKAFEKEDIYIPPFVDPIKNVEELLQDHIETVQNFLKAQTNTAITKVIGQYDEDNIKSVRWDIGSSTNTTIPSVSFEFTIKDATVIGKETYHRVIFEYAEPINLNDIANDYLSASTAIENATINADEEIEFEYNAREQFYRQSLTEALEDKVSVPGNSQVMIEFNEDVVGALNKTIYIVAICRENVYVEYSVEVVLGATDEETIANLSSAEVNEIKYVENENIYTEKEYVKDTYTVDDINTALYYFSDQIKTNLQTVYTFMETNYLSTYSEIKSYTWDLGTAENGYVSSLKLSTFVKTAETNTEMYIVYDITLPEQIAINDLLDKTTMEGISLNTTNVEIEYSYSYDVTTQGDKDNFIEAFVLYEEPDFDCTNATYIYTENEKIDDGDYGIARSFVLVVVGEKGVREYTIIMPNVEDDELENYAETGRYKLEAEKTVNFSNNQIAGTPAI